MELSTLKPCLVRPAKESDCTVTDCGSHVKRVLTWSDGKVEKHIVTLKEDNGDVMFVEEGHDVERVTVILKNPYRYEIYQETFVTRCGWRLACGASLPRTQCQWLLHRVKVFSMDWRIHLSSICRLQRSCCFFCNAIFLVCWRQRDSVSSARHHDFLNPCATQKSYFS